MDLAIEEAAKQLRVPKMEILTTMLMQRGRKVEKEKKPRRADDCQKIVEEAELSKYREEGWKIVTALPSGKIVITNE